VSQAEGVLITGVFGSGKSSVAAEIAYLLEQHGERFALLDLDYLSWVGPDTGDRAAEIELLTQNLAAIIPNYRRIGVTLFLLAYFVRDAAEGAGLADLTIVNDRPVGVAAQETMTFLDWR
jgi:hypothetical protein